MATFAEVALEAPEMPLGPPAPDKLASWDLFKAMGSPKYVVAPMVDQSELAWRILSRLHGASLCYTPMIHSTLFSNPSNSRYHHEQFDLLNKEEGDAKLDRPLIAQFCSNNKEHFLQSATKLAEAGVVDAVDLNLGCPQGIAKRGNYGAFLMEDWGLIENLISHLHNNLAVPVTAKFRVYDSLEKTLDYAKMLERAGAQILTVHGRTREQKGQITGLADWDKIRKVKEVLKVPVIANGNILSHKDVEKCIDETKVEGIMSAEGNLYNPAVFKPLNRPAAQRYRAQLPVELLAQLDEVDSRYQAQPDSAFYPTTQLSLQYLAIVRSIKTQTALSAVKAHLFRMWRPIFATGRHLDLRDELGKTSGIADTDAAWRGVVDKFSDLTHRLVDRLKADFDAGELQIDPSVALPETYDSRQLPYSHAQSIVRPLPEGDATTAMAKRSLEEVAQDDVVLDGASQLDAKKVKMTSDGVKVLQPAVKCKGCTTNNASARCIRGECKTCCAASTKENPEAEGCPEHSRKAQKEEEKREFRRKATEARRLKHHKIKADQKKGDQIRQRT